VKRLATLAALLAACGIACGHDPQPPAQSPSTTSAPEPAPAPSSEPAPKPFVPPPAAKGMFHSFDVAATSGRIDKVGGRDAALEPDGVKDLVFDVVVDGPVMAFVVVSVNATGQPDGAFSADTYVGGQTPPPEASIAMQPGKATSGIGVFENNKLVNASDGSLTPLADGRHNLVLYVSPSSELAKPKGSFRAYAIYDDKSVVESPTAIVK